MSVDLVKFFETSISQSLLQLDAELRFPGERNSKEIQATEEKPEDIVLQHNTNSLI